MSFEHLRVYQAAHQLDQEIRALVRTLLPEFVLDKKQLLRAASAVPYNIAEAYSFEDGRRRSFLAIARGSADETRAILRSLLAARAISEKTAHHLMNLARAVAKMLTSLIAKI